MPKLNTRIRDRIFEVFPRDKNPVLATAELTGLPYGTLRNAVFGHDEIGRHRINVLREALWPGECPSVDELISTAGSGGVPDEPPQKEQKKEENTGPKPREDKKGSGPKRANGVAA
jgi:hypothetical protein